MTDQALVSLVWDRANRTCEYCQLPQSFSSIPFEIDHIIAQKHGGPSEAANLALSCFYSVIPSFFGRCIAKATSDHGICFDAGFPPEGEGTSGPRGRVLLDPPIDLRQLALRLQGSLARHPQLSLTPHASIRRSHEASALRGVFRSDHQRPHVGRRGGGSAVR